VIQIFLDNYTKALEELSIGEVYIEVEESLSFFKTLRSRTLEDLRSD